MASRVFEFSMFLKIISPLEKQQPPFLKKRACPRKPAFLQHVEGIKTNLQNRICLELFCWSHFRVRFLLRPSRVAGLDWRKHRQVATAGLFDLAPRANSVTWLSSQLLCPISKGRCVPHVWTGTRVACSQPPFTPVTKLSLQINGPF